MGEKKRVKRDARQFERDRITTKQNASAAKKLKASMDEQELDNFDWLCTPECTCENGSGKCPMEKYKRHETCNIVKKGSCKVRACVTARKANVEDDTSHTLLCLAPP